MSPASAGEGAMFPALEAYPDQLARWPAAGRHILAGFDEETLVVYQAYRPAIADWAVAHQQLGGPDFSFSRMSWVKPNFLWMMYRCGWGTKADQERVLAIRVRRAFFEEILAAAVPSAWAAEDFATREAWQGAVAASAVRLQWDPDHDPIGRPVERRAIQLGLRGDVLRRFATEAVEIADATPIAVAGREHTAPSRWSELRTPRERVFRPSDPVVARRLRLAD